MAFYNGLNPSSNLKSQIVFFFCLVRKIKKHFRDSSTVSKIRERERAKFSFEKLLPGVNSISGNTLKLLSLFQLFQYLFHALAKWVQALI